MKKELLKTMIQALCVVSMVGCTTVNGGGNRSNHAHHYTEQIIAPTCDQQGYTLHECECGHSYKDSYKDAMGHDWTEGDRNYSCSRCGRSEAENFTFQLATMDGESCYAVTGIKPNAIINGVLNVPRKYESLPVRAIMNWSFSSVTKAVKKVLIHSNIKNIYSDLWHGTGTWTPDWETMSELEEIVFDDSCSGMRIESGAFNNCPKLARANISKGMIAFAPSDAVQGSNGGTADYLFKDTPYFKNNAIVKNGLHYVADLLLYANLNEVSNSMIVDSGTVWINACLFYQCTVLKSITIPNSVGVIGQSAFRNCANLETITFNGTVDQFKAINIGPSAFSGLKATSVLCTDGSVTSYVSDGYTYTIGA